MVSNLFMCSVLLLLCGCVPGGFSKGIYMPVTKYFEEVNKDLTKIAWAKVNSGKSLNQALFESSVMMIDADIVMGSHGPGVSADFTFVQFLDMFVTAIKVDGKRKGLKLNFKDIDGVEPSLKHLQRRLEEEEIPPFPLFIAADILAGPVDAKTKPLDPKKFLPLVQQYTPFATLCVGWTTRYGMDDSEDEIREGNYETVQVKEMQKLLRPYTDKRVFHSIVFTVRASLAAQSINELLPLTSRTYSSLLLWSPMTDSVNKVKLQSLLHQASNYKVFVDLPFDIHGEEPESEVVSGDSQSDHADHHHNHPVPKSPSGVQQLEGRAPNEDHTEKPTTSSSPSMFLMKTVVSLCFVVSLLL